MHGSRLACLLLGTVVVAAPAFAQNLLVNGSFEVPDYPPGPNVNVPVTGWTVAPGPGFEVWDNFDGPAADGAQHLELDVSTCTTISQTIPTDGSTYYLIRFAFGARTFVADNRVEVLWNGQVVGSAAADGTSQSQIGWTYYSFQVLGGPGSSTLAIRNVDVCDGLGAMLDDVSVTARENIPMLGAGGLALLTAVLALAGLIVLRRLGAA
jgi:hypothetical protein